MNGWTTCFVERAAELELLASAWEQAKAGVPQLVVLTAPPGLGKTRLVQEFYHSVSTRDDGAGGRGYWPDTLSRERDRLRIAPPASDCNSENPMPFLWWAIKLVDSGDNRSGSADLHLAYETLLRPHLEVMRRSADIEALSRAQWREGRGGMADLAKSGAEMALNAIPVIGPFLGLVRTLFESAWARGRKIRELARRKAELAERAAHVAAAARAGAASFEERLLGELRGFCRPRGGAVRPMILVVDDGQFADQDPSLASLLRALITSAWSESWPMLLIMTHWTREWNEGVENPHSLPGFVVEGATRIGISWKRVSLAPICDLAPLAETAIPGLPAEQLQLLLRKAGGNPRYLERIIQLLTNSPMMFDSRAPNGPIRAEALDDIRDETFDIHEVTRRLYESAPLGVRQAAALASTQGERFLCDLVRGVAARLEINLPERSLEQCEHPLAVVGGVSSGIGEFVQSVYREVAQAMGPRVAGSQSAVRAALAAELGERIDLPARPGFEAERQLTLEVAGALAGSPDLTEAEAGLASTALIRQLQSRLESGDMPSARRLARLWREGAAFGRWDRSKLSAADLGVIASFDAIEGRYTDARDQSVEHLVKVRELVDAGDLGSVHLAGAMLQHAEVVQALEGPRAALPLLRDAEANVRAVADLAGDTEGRLLLARITSKIGEAVDAIDGPAAARAIYEDSVAVWKMADGEGPVTDVVHRFDSQLGLADCLRRLGDGMSAEALLKEVLERLGEDPAADPRIRRVRARSRRALAELLAERGAMAIPGELFLQACDEFAGLLAETQSPAAARDLATAIVAKCKAERQLGKIHVDENLGLSRCRQLLEEAYAASRSVVALGELLEVEIMLPGKVDRANRKGLDRIVQRLAEVHSTLQVPVSARRLGSGYIELSEWYTAQGRYRQGLEAIREAVAVLSQYAMEEFDVQGRRSRILARIRLAAFERWRGNARQAMAAARAAVNEAAECIRASRDSDLANLLVQARTLLAGLFIDAGRPARARAELDLLLEAPLGETGDYLSALSHGGVLSLSSRLARVAGDVDTYLELDRKIAILNSIQMDQRSYLYRPVDPAVLGPEWRIEESAPPERLHGFVVDLFEGKLARTGAGPALIECFAGTGGTIVVTNAKAEPSSLLDTDGRLHIDLGGSGVVSPLLYISYVQAVMLWTLLVGFECAPDITTDREAYGDLEVEIRYQLLFNLTFVVHESQEEAIVRRFQDESPHGDLYKAYLEDLAAGEEDSVTLPMSEWDFGEMRGNAGHIRTLADAARGAWHEQAPSTPFEELVAATTAISGMLIRPQQMALCTWLTRLGYLAMRRGEVAAAIIFFETVVTHRRQLLADADASRAHFARNVLPAAVADLAWARYRAQGPAAAEAEYREAHELYAQLASEDDSPARRIAAVQAESRLIWTKAFEADAWERAFAIENPDPARSKPALDAFAALAEGVRSWASEAGPDAAAGWFEAIGVQMATLERACGDVAAAEARLERLMPSLRRWARAFPDPGGRWLALGLLALGQCRLASGKRGQALAALEEVLAASRADIGGGELHEHRTLAVACWYAAEASSRDGDGERFEALLREGREAAARFVRFGSMDGAAILRAFEARLAGR
jgi:tetratricopeptide (TPR) repeat protein